jgi:hypothetical protein
MERGSTIPRRALALGLGLFLGCAGTPGVATPEVTPKAPYTQAPPTPTISPIATVAPTRHGRPYTPDMFAAAMFRTSSIRLPDLLKSEFIAAAFADRVWTYDGQPYREMLFSGSCSDDGSRCEASVLGLPAYAPDRNVSDHYSFSVDFRSGPVVKEEGHVLHGFPAEAASGLDDLARSLVPDERLAGARLTSVAWTLPPPENAFGLIYRLGDLEGSRLTTVTIDLDARKVMSIQDQTLSSGSSCSALSTGATIATR